MHQRGSLQRLAGTLPCNSRPREGSQLRIDQRQQFVGELRTKLGLLE